MPAINGLACPHDCPRVEVCNHLNPGQGTNSSLCSLHTKRGLPLSQSVNPGHQSMSRYHTRLPARVLLRRVQMLWLFNRLPRDHYPSPRSGNHVPPVKQSRLVTANGDVYRGRYAILTGTPVALSTHLTWEPPLPAGADAMLRRARIGNYNKHYAFFNAGPTWREQPETWEALQRRAVQWPMVYEALPPLPPSSQQMPNGTAFFPSAIIDNSPPTLLASAATSAAAASVVDGEGGDGEKEGGGGCANGAGALFSFGWPQNGTTAAQRAEGWRALLAGVPGLPHISSVVGQAWAEEPLVMGAYGAWWPPGVVSAAGEQWAVLPGGRVFFAGSEWSDVGAGYMNGAIHNGRKRGSLVARLLERELRGEVEL